MAEPPSHDTYTDDNFTCRICYQLFDDNERTPRILGCMHTICDTCIKKLTERNTYVLCPFCKNTWQVPISGFPENRLVKTLMFNKDSIGKVEKPPQKVDCESCDESKEAAGFCNDCEMNVCETCIKTHKLMKITRDHEIEKSVPQLTRKRSSKSRCKRHLTEYLSVFCSTCKTTTCNTCFITGHNGHECVDLQKAVDKTKHKLVLLAERCKEKLKPLQQLLSTIDEITGNVDLIQSQNEQIVDEVFGAFLESVKEQSEIAKVEIRDLCDAKRQSLKSQKEDVQSVCAEYESASDFAEQLCKLSKPEELLDLQQQVTDRLDELIKRDEKNAAKFKVPLINTHLQFTDDHAQAAEEFSDVTTRLGHFHTSSTIPSLCYIEPADVPGKRQESGSMVINREQKIKILAVSYDQEAKKNERGGDPFMVTLKDPTGTTVECRVEDQDDGTYTALYLPKVSGKHSLDVKLFGKPISGSPFSFKAYPMKYQPVNIQQGPRVTWQEAPIAGVPHSINISLSNGEDHQEDGELEAKVNAIVATIFTDDDVAVDYKVELDEDETRLIYTPPKVGNLHVTIKVNGRPVVEPFQLTVTALENSLSSWQLEQPPVVGQRWVLTVDLRNHLKEEIQLDSSTLGVVISDHREKSGDLYGPRYQRVDSKHEFECVCSWAGTQHVSLQVNGSTVSRWSLKASDQFHFSKSQSRSSFPSSVESSSTGMTYLSDTKLGCIYAHTSDKTAFTNVAVDTKTASAQLTVDEQSLLYLLVVEDRYVQVLTNEGRKITQWQCNEKNGKPVTIAASRYKQEDLVVIGDATLNTHALFLYKKDGTLISSIPLPRGCLMDGLDNICVDTNGCILLCNFDSPEIIKIDFNNGYKKKTFRTPSRNKQLAITATSDGLVLTSEKGRINIYDLNDDADVQDCKVIQTSDHIYTSLSGISDGCVVALDVKLKQLIKYGYSHL